MFPSPRQGNVHPSVANRLGAGASLLTASNASPTQGLGGASSADLVGAFNTSRSLNAAPQVAIDEAEARAKAREILSEFVQQRTKATTLESHLQKSMQENERMNHLLQERRTEAAIERERAAREIDSLRRETSEADTLVRASRDEVRRVAQACAQRASDTSSHLRLKEQETMQLEAELLKAREEARGLRAEVKRLQSMGTSVEEAEQTQQRLVDLARRLLESEKAKANLERSMSEDRRLQHHSLRTIESLQRQVQETVTQLRDAETRVGNEREAHERAINALHREMDSQRETYKQFIERMGQQGGGGFGGVSDNALNSLKAAHATQVALLAAQLENGNAVAKGLSEQLERAVQDASRCREDLEAMRRRHVEDVTHLQALVHQAEYATLKERETAGHNREAQQRDKDNFERLTAVHDALKKDYDAVARRVATAEAALTEAITQHRALDGQLVKLKEEGDAREAVERHVADLLETRRGMEKRLADEINRHEHETQMLKMQLATAARSGMGGNGSAAIDMSAFMAMTQNSSSYRDLEGQIQQLKARVVEFEAERDRWEAERRALCRGHDEEKRALQGELERVSKLLDDARLATAEARAQQGASQREREEWAAAFAYSERCRAKLQGRIDEMEADRHDISKERATTDTRLTVLQSQLHRTEQQADRDSQEIFRLRRTVAALEVDLAKRDAEVKRLEIARLEALQQNTPSLAARIIAEHRDVMQSVQQASSPKPAAALPTAVSTPTHAGGITAADAQRRLDVELSVQRTNLEEREREVDDKARRYAALDASPVVAADSTAVDSAADAEVPEAAAELEQGPRESPESTLAQMATMIFARTRAPSLPPREAPPSASM